MVSHTGSARLLGLVTALLLVLGGCEVRPGAPTAPTAPTAGADTVHGTGHAPPMHGHGQPVPLPSATGIAATTAIDLSTSTDVSGLIDHLTDRHIVYLGEQHDRYEQHLLQLAVIRGLYERGIPVAIGMEQFQRRFQPALDAFIAGEIDTPEMLRRSEYYQRWRFDYRLYRPILDFAREHGIPLVALNAEVELTRRVGEVGLDGLDAEERARLPAEYGPLGADYRARLSEVFGQHPGDRKPDFTHFVEVQLSWDETMAETAVNYVTTHPERHLLVLVGAGHVINRYGIPDRVQRRQAVSDAVVLLGGYDDASSDTADWMLLPAPAPLPPSGKMGILMDDSDQGVRVMQVVPGSGAEDAGMLAGDVLTVINGRDIENTGDVRVALLGRGPGEVVAVKIRRQAANSSLSLTLKAH